MAKPKGNGSVPQKHLYSRLSYLHQAAAFLGSQAAIPGTSGSAPSISDSKDRAGQSLASDQFNLTLARHILTELRATSLKTQIRLSPAIKHTICKFCDALLIEGKTCTSVVENKSKGAKKPWADILVVKCNTCGEVRRFPVQAPRQKRRPQRQLVSNQVLKEVSKESEGSIKTPELSDDKHDITMKEAE